MLKLHFEHVFDYGIELKQIFDIARQVKCKLFFVTCKMVFFEETIRQILDILYTIVSNENFKEKSTDKISPNFDFEKMTEKIRKIENSVPRKKELETEITSHCTEPVYIVNEPAEPSIHLKFPEKYKEGDLTKDELKKIYAEAGEAQKLNTPFCKPYRRNNLKLKINKDTTKPKKLDFET